MAIYRSTALVQQLLGHLFEWVCWKGLPHIAVFLLYFGHRLHRPSVLSLAVWMLLNIEYDFALDKVH